MVPAGGIRYPSSIWANAAARPLTASRRACCWVNRAGKPPSRMARMVSRLASPAISGNVVCSSQAYWRMPSIIAWGAGAGEPLSGCWSMASSNPSCRSTRSSWFICPASYPRGWCRLFTSTTPSIWYRSAVSCTISPAIFSGWRPVATTDTGNSTPPSISSCSSW